MKEVGLGNAIEIAAAGIGCSARLPCEQRKSFPLDPETEVEDMGWGGSVT